MDRIRMVWLSMLNGTIVVSLGAEVYRLTDNTIDTNWPYMEIHIGQPSILNHLLCFYRLQPATGSACGNTYSFISLSLLNVFFYLTMLHKGKCHFCEHLYIFLQPVYIQKTMWLSYIFCSLSFSCLRICAVFVSRPA